MAGLNHFLCNMWHAVWVKTGNKSAQRHYLHYAKRYAEEVCL